MKRLKTSLIIGLLATYGIMALPAKGQVVSGTSLQNSLTFYTGKYEMRQGNKVLYALVFIDKNILFAKASDGQLLQLKNISGDNFIIVNQNLPIKFIRDKDNKVVQIAVNGNPVWIRINNQPAAIINAHQFNNADYLGKYQIKADNQLLVIEVSLKKDQLWATQLWDGGSSALDFKYADNFIVNALSMPIKFIRDTNDKVIQLLLNNHDLFNKTN